MKLDLKMFLLPESNLEFPQHPVFFFFSYHLGTRVGEAFHNKCHLSLYFQSFLFLTHTIAF